MVLQEKTPKKRASKKAIEEVGEGEKSNSSFKFDDVFVVDFFGLLTKGRKKPKGELSSSVLGIATLFTINIDKLDGVEAKVDHFI